MQNITRCKHVYLHMHLQTPIKLNWTWLVDAFFGDSYLELPDASQTWLSFPDLFGNGSQRSTYLAGDLWTSVSFGMIGLFKISTNLTGLPPWGF